MEIREIIDRYYEYVNAGDWDRWMTLFADDVIGDEQLAGHFEGINTLKDAGEGVKKGYSQFLMIPQHIILGGYNAAVIWRCIAANAKKVPIAYPNDPTRPVVGANYFEVHDGKITYMRTIHDSLPFGPFLNQ